MNKNSDPVQKIFLRGGRGLGRMPPTEIFFKLLEYSMGQCSVLNCWTSMIGIIYELIIQLKLIELAI